MVDVGAFHQKDFFLHLYAGDGMTSFGVSFMSVDALQLDGLSVEIIIASCQSEFVVGGGGVFDFYLAETHDGRHGFNHLAFLVFQLGH